MAGSVILLVLVAAVIAASVFHSGAYVAEPSLAFTPPAWEAHGSASHLLGTDEIGRDVLGRLLYGIRVSMIVGIASVVVAALAGLLVGVLAGYIGGWLDNIPMRLTDGIMAIPVILLAISIIGAVVASPTTLVFVLAGS